MAGLWGAPYAQNVNLRITGGRARGRVLRGDLREGIRPTGARVREAIFSALGQNLSGQTFLDAFAGSGIMALEAWSRGAEVTAVERDPRKAREIVDRVREIGGDVAVRTADVTRLVPEVFDVVYADPPFALDPAPLVSALAPWVGRTLLLEAERSTARPTADGLSFVRTRRFGTVVVHEYRC